MEFHFAGEQKLFSADNEQQVWIALRSVTSTRPKPIAWRDRHSYMNGENITWNDDGTLCVTGYIRGRELSANSLVHIQNYGDFQISKITSAVHPLYKTMDVDPTVLAVPDSRQESLVSENEPDMMEGEQTWPTEDEIKEAEDRVKSLAAKPRKIKVPRGFSAYQAAWIATSEDEVSDSGEDDQDHDMDNNNAQDDQQQESEYSESEDDLVEIDAIENETVADTEQELGREEEERQYAEYLSSRKKQKDSAQDLLFPDEMDTPMNIAARVRFQRFRGLKSFRNTPWDAYENLPIDYSRIFQFQNFNKTRSKVFKDLNNLDDDPCVVSSGIYATIHIANVPLEAFTEYSQDSSKPRILFSLLPHEHKMSVASFTITRPSINSIAESLASAAAKNDDMASILGTDSKTEDGISISLPSFKLPDDYIVKSKEQVVMCCGFRRYLIKPIYSIESRGSSNNVNKFVRFLQPGTTSIASCYAPIQFAPTPITLFKMSSSTGISCLT